MKPKKLTKLREEARQLIREDKNTISMRSCWKCNPAHKHFKKGEWGKWVLWCFECGKFYYKGVDITE